MATGLLHLTGTILIIVHAAGWAESLEAKYIPDLAEMPRDFMPAIISSAAAIVYLASSRMKITPENWGAGIFCLVAGLLCCTLPAIILLVFWLQPQTKYYFQTRGPAPRR